MHALVRNGNCIFAKILHNGATAKEHGRFFYIPRNALPTTTVQKHGSRPAKHDRTRPKKHAFATVWQMP